jgi:anti-sigma regulatory factor (Ser/Thr protein kinase)
MSCELLLAGDRPIPRDVPRTCTHLALEPSPTAPRQARAFVQTNAPPLDGGQLEVLLVLTSELVTNAVLHARTPLEVGVTVAEQLVVVSVSDLAAEAPQASDFSDRRESGRGLVLVEGLADDWGVVPAEHRPGKAVWFSLRREEGMSGLASSDGAARTAQRPVSGEAAHV